MSKKFLVFIVAIFAILAAAVFAAAPALAIFGLEQTASQAGYNANSPDLTGSIRNVVTTILGFVALGFFGLVLYGGFVWITARGKEERVETAKNILEAAAIGLGIIAASYALTTLVFSRLQAGGGGRVCYCSDINSCFPISDEQTCTAKNLGCSLIGSCPKNAAQTP